MPRKAITVLDILLLIDRNGESDEHIVISDQCEEETWVEIPMNSRLLWTEETLKCKVNSLGTYNGMIQIWLEDKEDECKCQSN